jgi:TonB family protein
MLSEGVLPRTTSLNDISDYQRVLGLWRQAAATHAESLAVLGNAAQFLQASGEYDEAERLLLQAKALQPLSATWSQRLGTLYAAAILGATGDPKFPHQNPAFANRVKTQLESSDDRIMVTTAGSALVQTARRPENGRPLPPGTLNLDDHPLLLPAVDFGARLVTHADDLRVVGGVVGGGPIGGIVGGTPGGTRGGVTSGVVGGVAGPIAVARDTALQASAPPPPIVRKVDPVYPPLALQARISGVVRLAVIIQPDGSIRHIQVISGHPLLVPAAIEAVKQWTFQPSAAEVTTTIEVPFILSDAAAQSLPPLPGDTPRKKGSMAPSRIKVGSNVQAARLVQRVDPVYPEEARSAGVEGIVTLQIVIGNDGSVTSADPVDGNPVLWRAAADAVKQWKYQPTLLNGEPVEVQTTVPVRFELK